MQADALRALLAGSERVVLLDCGFDLTDTAAGERAFVLAHIAGAHYAHLDRDLCGPMTGHNGRHPLPTREALAATAGRWGIAPGVQVVAYDDHGAVYAARAWWLLRWLGHARVAVLDGGRAAWLAGGGMLDDRPAARSAPGAPYPPAAPSMPTASANDVLLALGRQRLLDARAPERFRGEVEPFDPVAGHIPGATCRFHKNNLDRDGRFKPASRLRAEFEAIGASHGAVVHLCGSGVTACHNLLAMAHAGLPSGVLYPGSWSEWCSDAARPIATG
jgi:thiosulfate/3-mercaptopyruvate sulfurtransferase